MKKEKITAECVSAGHPDKICDQIADAILDECLRQDVNSRVAVEVMGGHGKLYILGEITSKADFLPEEIARRVYQEVGYGDELEIVAKIVQQSGNIAAGMDTGGAGDQGVMTGYATAENEVFLPNELFLAREILQKLPEGFGPDAKSQVVLDEGGGVERVILSAQHKSGADFLPLVELAESYLPKKGSYVNATGVFEKGGFEADSGVTGRKIVVDNYGPRVPVGGGAFSGKDSSKVDRSGAYMARRIAVDYVKSGEASEALVQIGYSIGVAEPVLATALLDGEKMVDLLSNNKYDLQPRAIEEFLDLRKPIYEKTAREGHFGKGFLWDR